MNVSSLKQAGFIARPVSAMETEYRSRSTGRIYWMSYSSDGYRVTETKNNLLICTGHSKEKALDLIETADRAS